MSRSLEVRDFSCIANASIEFKRLTLIIGPQASGKSVLCKLAYFFNSLLIEQFQQIEDGQSPEEFKAYVALKFKQLFPVSAWGAKKFAISYLDGEYEVRISRSSAKSENLRIIFSEFFSAQYEENMEAYRILRQKSGGAGVGARIEAEWSVRRKMMAELRKKMGSSFAQYQLFVPAGRSFFTNAGKAIMLLDQGNLVDPIVGRFGRIFANFREHYQFDPPARRAATAGRWREILGGELKIERDREYIESVDGRKIPFVALSSGQQELLPLLLVLDGWAVPSRSDGKQHLFIEEPEAHLFPSAQSKLVEIFADMLSGAGGMFDLILTTHSPYVLAKINNLVLAGQVGQADGGINARVVSKIVRKSAWITRTDLSAYSLDDGRAKEIVDEDGLIDGAYLDSISDEISKEFGKLLAIQHSDRRGDDA